MDLVAYLDESRKPVRDPATGKVAGNREHYIVAAAVVLRADGEAIRQHIASVERDLGFGLHYRHLRSRARKVAALEAIVAMPDWDGYLFETSAPIDFRRYPEAFVRAAILKVAFPRLAKVVGDGGVVIESRGMRDRPLGGLDQADVTLASKLRRAGEVGSGFVVEHATKEDALLAIPDLLAGVRGDDLCGVDRSLYPRVAHRIRGVEKAL